MRDGAFPIYQVHERAKAKDHWLFTTDEVSAFKTQFAEELKRDAS